MSFDPTPSMDSTQQTTLENLVHTIPGVLSALLVTLEGEVRAIAGPERETFAAMAAFAVGLNELLARLCEDSGLGVEDLVVARAERGHVVLCRVSDDEVLMVFARAQTRLGVLVNDTEMFARELERQGGVRTWR